MNRIILATLCFFFAVYASHQQGNLTVTEIMSGTTANGVLLPTTVADNYNVQIYKFWIPINATNATINFVNTNTASCSYLHLFLRSGGLPCSYHDYSSDYICTSAADPGNGVSTQTVNMYPGYSSSLFEWGVNQYQYIAIGRYSTYNTAACSYTINVNVAVPCTTSQVAIGSSSSQTCVNYVAATSGASVAQTVDQMYRVVVADGTGNVQVIVNSTSTGLYIYGANFYGPSTSNYQYYTGSYTTVGSFYIYTLNCYTPRAGDFYVYIDLDEASNNTVTINYNPCAMGMGGYNCTFTSSPLNVSALAAGVALTVPADVNSMFLDDGFSYLYYDVPNMETNMNNEVAITATVTGGSGYAYFRRGGFNEDSSTYGYEDSDEYDAYPSMVMLNNFEYGVAGRIYLGYDCQSSTTNCIVTVSANSTSGPVVATTGAAVTTQAAVTTGIRVTTGLPAVTTQAAVTTGIRITTGIDVTTAVHLTTMSADSASYVVAPFVAVVVALVALLF